MSPTACGDVPVCQSSSKRAELVIEPVADVETIAWKILTLGSVLANVLIPSLKLNDVICAAMFAFERLAASGAEVVNEPEGVMARV